MYEETEIKYIVKKGILRDLYGSNKQGVGKKKKKDESDPMKGGLWLYGIARPTDQERERILKPNTRL